MDHVLLLGLITGCYVLLGYKTKCQRGVVK